MVGVRQENEVPPAVPQMTDTPRLVIATEADAVRLRVEKWIRRGEEIESRYATIPTQDQIEERNDPEWNRTMILFIDQLTKSERSTIRQWHEGVIQELERIGRGALGLYTADEALSVALFSALRDNRRFLRERLDELRAILARIPSEEDRAGEVRASDLLITFARYGAGRKEADVNDMLNDLIEDGVLDFTVNKEWLGVDPAPNKRKILRMRWTVGGQNDSRSFHEDTHVVLPD